MSVFTGPVYLLAWKRCLPLGSQKVSVQQLPVGFFFGRLAEMCINIVNYMLSESKERNWFSLFLLSD